MTAAIATYDLTKTYGQARGIRDINLTVERGEIFGFLGPNGAGKSTTLRTVLGFMKPSSGRAEVLGFDSWTEKTRMHAHIGNLPGEFSLEDRMTGRELIRFFARLRGVRDLAFAEELATRLDANLDRPMRRLSRGNKQKIGIIQALFHQPEVVILDEPTGGLDPLVQEEFLKLLAEARERGQTVFFSSHVLAEIERLADRVGIIREGELIAVEDPTRLTQQAFRHVRIAFARLLTLEEQGSFAQLPGVEQFRAEDGQIMFDDHGSFDELVKLAAQFPVASLDVERPTLEEIFLTYYGAPAETAAKEAA
jgi:ABC-2 type transport system ATP-binding protein